MGSHKPAWREMIADDWSKGVTGREYWRQISVYAELAITAAKQDLSKLAELIDRLDDLPLPARDQLLAHLVRTQSFRCRKQTGSGCGPGLSIWFQSTGNSRMRNGP